MKYIEWTPAIRTGVSSIDVQHKALIHAINDLGKELEEGRGEASIKKTVSFLKYYTEWLYRVALRTRRRLRREASMPDRRNEQTSTRQVYCDD